MKSCPCGAQKPYESCCGIYITGQATPETPEQLMRSRYTAYTLSQLDYIAQSMVSPALDAFNRDEASEWSQKVSWEKLKIISSSLGVSKGFVEFAAFYSINGQKQLMHELSEFILLDRRWYYKDGKQPKLSRNDPCVCGSGKKFKKCCGR